MTAQYYQISDGGASATIGVQSTFNDFSSYFCKYHIYYWTL